MGFKLQDRIQRTKGLPGKYKRLLLAMASHAYKDGTNVWAAKTTLAEEMGTDRRTVNRNMDGLLMTGLVREAETHRCSNVFCSKGGLQAKRFLTYPSRRIREWALLEVREAEHDSQVHGVREDELGLN